MKVISILFLGCFVSCISKAPFKKACTEEAREELNIIVRDDRLNKYLFDSISVVATSGAYSESLQLNNTQPPTFSGAWERDGNYVITITKPGYKTFTSATITVAKDECHIIPQTNTFVLQSN